MSYDSRRGEKGKREDVTPAPLDSFWREGGGESLPIEYLFVYRTEVSAGEILGVSLPVIN